MIIRVLFVATSYPAGFEDWRALFMRHIVDALGRTGALDLALWAPEGELAPGASAQFLFGRGDRQWLAGLMQGGGIAHLLRSHGLRAIPTVVALLARLRRIYRATGARGGVVHANWLQTVLPLPPRGRPLLVTVLGSDLRLLDLPMMKLLIRRVLRRREAVICPNAAWMVPRLQACFGDVARVECVPFGIDPCWYGVRREFGGSRPVRWLCVSRLTKDKLGPLLEWGRSYFEHGRAELHVFGPMQESIDLPPWVHWHGPASPEALCNHWFPYAHGLVTLSQHSEGLPQVMLEALAAGLPVIASRLPAHEELLGNGAGGVLCGSQQEFLDALERLSEPALNRALGARGQAMIRREYGTWDDCAARYLTQYRSLLAGASA